MPCTTGRSRHILLKKDCVSDCNCCNTAPYSVGKICCNDELINKQECPVVIPPVDCSSLNDLVCQVLNFDEAQLIQSISVEGLTPLGICNYISFAQPNFDFTNLDGCTGTIIVDGENTGGPQSVITLETIDGELMCTVNEGFESVDLFPPLNISFEMNDSIDLCITLVF